MPIVAPDVIEGDGGVTVTLSNILWEILMTKNIKFRIREGEENGVESVTTITVIKSATQLERQHTDDVMNDVFAAFMTSSVGRVTHRAMFVMC